MWTIEDAGANLFPRLYVDLHHAACDKDMERVRMLHNKVMQISASIYNIGNFGSSYLKGVKCTLSLLGICNDFLAAPFNKFGDEQKEKIRKALDQLDVSY